MSLSDVGIKEDCLYRLSFESGIDVELVHHFDPVTEIEYLRVCRHDLENKLFDPIIKHTVIHLNTAKRRISLDDRVNPRYGPLDVRKHLIVLFSDVHSAHRTLQVGEEAQLFCQVLSRSGPVIVNGIEQFNPLFGKITQSIQIEPPSLPRRI